MGPPDEIRVLDHQLDRLGLGGWLRFQISLPIQRRPSIEKSAKVGIADQRLQLLCAQGGLAEVTFLQLCTQAQQETSCLTTGGSGGLVIENDWLLCHRCLPFVCNLPCARRSALRPDLPALRLLDHDDGHRRFQDYFVAGLAHGYAAHTAEPP